ncbi:MAG: protein-L-isoaspartate(D-aspartate) O-methyltransferase [Gammaproteobacteria bacterium]|nr:protein-L-isoaspartate(D-aspartate) O-methyltransferase [Gammaproteobacteria bacterium]
MQKPDLRGIGMTSQRARDRLVEQLREMGIRSEIVLELIRGTPRHLFVDEALASRAYDNTALPIGHNQTISQPYIVARMTEALIETGIPGTVLEIGTGCGYQTAVLARLGIKVYTIERIEALIQRARERFRLLQLDNIVSRHGDGSLGWADQAPFDGILATAAPVGVPGMLRSQLGIGGRLILPVGRSGEQALLRIMRTPDGYEQQQLDWVSFVPMLEGTS